MKKILNDQRTEKMEIRSNLKNVYWVTAFISQYLKKRKKKKSKAELL